jgi:hypothetical protein
MDKDKKDSIKISQLLIYKEYFSKQYIKSKVLRMSEDEIEEIEEQMEEEAAEEPEEEIPPEEVAPPPPPAPPPHKLVVSLKKEDVNNREDI